MRLTEGQKAYNRRIKKYISERDKLTTEYEKEVIKMVKVAKEKIIFDIKNVSQGEWSIYNTQRLIEKLNVNMQELNQKFGISGINAVYKMADFTTDSIDDAIEKAGWNVPGKPINPAILQAEREIMFYLINDFTQANTNKLSVILNLGLQGGKSTLQVAEDIEEAFGDVLYERTLKRRQYKKVFAHANRIARTEVSRTNSMIENEKNLQASQINSDLRKEWNSTFKPDARPEHVSAHNRYHANPIPVNEPFYVMGEALMHPLDPAGSAKNNINCSCYETLIKLEVTK